MRHIGTIKNTDIGEFGIGTDIGNILGIGIAEATNGPVAKNFTQTTSTKIVAADTTKKDLAQGFSNVHCSKGTDMHSWQDSIQVGVIRISNFHKNDVAWQYRHIL